MDITRAFTYAFEDKEWASKLAMTAVVVFASAVLTPLLVGFVGWAAIAGYLVELVANIRDGVAQPLPTWNDFGGKIGRGVNVLTAVIVYNLPLALIGCCSWVLNGIVGNSSGNSIIVLAMGCCLLPFSLIYTLLSWPILALALGRYIDDERLSVFFEIGSLVATLQERREITVQYVVFTFLADLALGVLGLIPCIGWVAGAMLAVPVHGALIGQFASAILGKLKRKQPPPRPAYR